MLTRPAKKPLALFGWELGVSGGNFRLSPRESNRVQLGTQQKEIPVNGVSMSPPVDQHNDGYQKALYLYHDGTQFRMHSAAIIIEYPVYHPLGFLVHPSYQDRLFVGRAVRYSQGYYKEGFSPHLSGRSEEPLGTIKTFETLDCLPTGWMECAGQQLGVDRYPHLFIQIYGENDWYNHPIYTLPDLRGEFIRGWDNGRGIDAGRVLGSAQGDTLKAHSHLIKWWAVESGLGASAYSNQGYDLDHGGTETSGDTETRPRNVAKIYAMRVL